VLLACGLLHGDAVLADSCPPAPLVASAQYFAALGATSTALGDFTNDGKADVVVTTNDGTLVFPGNGNGALGAPVLSPPNVTGSIVTGYFDGDSNLDIAVAGSQSLYVLLGNGDGTFQDPVPYGNGFDIQARLAAGYFNGDAHVDLVETDGSGHALWIYLGHGDGTFDEPVAIDVAGRPVDVAVADFNGDGHADFAVALGSFDDTGFLILLGNGDGTFAPPVEISTGIQVTSIAAADLDSDGNADVVVGEPTEVSIFRGNGDGTFRAAETFPTTGNSVLQVLALDLDDDGLLDVAALQPGALLEILQSASHAFAPGPDFLAVGDRLAAGDLNGDALPDFALPSYSPGSITVVLSTPGSYLSARSVAPGFQPLLLAAGDFDGDGLADLFVAGAGVSTQSAVLLNAGGIFEVKPTPIVGAPAIAVVADLTGDGKQDLINGFFGGFIVEVGQGDGTFTPGSQYALSGPANGIVVADLDSDGIPDVAVLSVGNGGGGELSVFLGMGGGTFTPLAPLEFSSPTPSLAAGDFDGDGIPDLVVAFGGYDGSHAAGLLLGNGDGTFRAGGTFLTGINPFALSAGDFNEDGNLDVVAANAGSTNVSLLLGDGAGGFSPVRLVNVGGTPLGLAAADIDGDGHLDLATANDAALPVGVGASVLLGDGTGAFLAPIAYPTAPRPQAVVAGAFGPSGRNGIAIAADNDWVVDIFLNGGLTSATASGGGAVVVGSRAILSVAATSGRPLTYQWRKGGVPLVDGGRISGATSARLTIDPVSFDDAGSYDVIVTDGCGQATSNVVNLSVEFADVPVSSPFHADILTIATEGITSGCGGGNYCPTSPVRRDQMAVFLLKSEHGSAYMPPPCSGTFPDVSCPSPFADWIEQLATEGVTSGCGGGNYCPDSSVTRAQMAVFLLKTRNGSAYVPPPALGIFGDVPVGAFAADFIEALYNAAITGGCQASPLLYCPGNAVVRQQMATFLVRTFAP